MIKNFLLQKGNTLILGIILVVGVVLRFYHFSDIPLTHDEFSALFRTEFESLRELIHFGVMPDGHPAGVQVFLYYWVKWFGREPWVIKLPFAISGVVSIWLVYKIGKRWFNTSVGLYAAAMISGLQFTVMYSQIARPYISGLFLSLAMIWYWSYWWDNHRSRNKWHVLGYIILGSLTAYNHHFSLLLVILVWGSGLLMIDKSNRKRYFLSGLAIFILYLPHLSIFLYQLHIGGVTWLGKPTPRFFTDYLGFGFNFSYWVYGLVIALTIGSFIFRKQNGEPRKRVLLSLFLYAAPVIIGFTYSVLKTPVLQYSMLIFTFPFLLFTLFGFIKRQTVVVNTILVGLLLSTTIYSLIQTRKHYTLFYTSFDQQAVLDYVKVQSVHGETLSFVDFSSRISDHYLREHNLLNEINYHWRRLENDRQIQQDLKASYQDHDLLFLSARYDVIPTAIPWIMAYYPHIEWVNNYAGGSTYLFSKKDKTTPKHSFTTNFDTEVDDHWNGNDVEANNSGTNGSIGLVMKDRETFSPSLTYTLGELYDDQNDFIDIRVDVHLPGNGKDIRLVAEINDGKQKLHWSAKPASTLVDLSQKGWVRIIHSIKLSDIRGLNAKAQVKIYLWKDEGTTIPLDNIIVSTRSGNPYLYGLIERF